MKLIKINTDHYIIVDDSEIKEGDWFLSKENIIHNNYGWNYGDKKITYSTQPLDTIILKNRDHSQSVGHYYGNGGQLSLQEVKELLGEVDVDNIVDELSEKPHYTHSSQQEWFKIGAYSGYTQALEDNKEKKYTEEDIRKAWEAGMKFIVEDKGRYSNFIQSIQPKTEWEVEFIDDELKLKQ